MEKVCVDENKILFIYIAKGNKLKGAGVVLNVKHTTGYYISESIHPSELSQN